MTATTDFLIVSVQIEMYRAREELSDDLMLQDIALIYSWRGVSISDSLFNLLNVL